MAAEDSRHAETEAILQDVVKVFAEKGDVTMVREVGRTILEIEAEGDARHKQMKESIKELAGQVERAKQDHSEQQVSLLNPAQKQLLLAERDRVQDNIKRLRQENGALREQHEQAEKKTREQEAKKAEIKASEAVEVPRARHTISLYANISSIRWDKGSENVKGWVTSSSGIKAFELDAASNSDFFVTNCLWDLMDAC